MTNDGTNDGDSLLFLSLKCQFALKPEEKTKLSSHLAAATPPLMAGAYLA